MTTTPRSQFLKDDARSVRSVLHSRVYLLLVGFALWFALAVWGFAGGGLSNYLLVIVSGFISPPRRSATGFAEPLARRADRASNPATGRSQRADLQIRAASIYSALGVPCADARPSIALSEAGMAPVRGHYWGGMYGLAS